MTQQEQLYRENHGVLPCLDRVQDENCLQKLPHNAVTYSRFAEPTPRKLFSGKDAVKGVKQGFGKGMKGMLHMATGHLGSGLGEVLGGAVQMGYGGILGDGLQKEAEKQVIELVKSYEDSSRDGIAFLRSFVPASKEVGKQEFHDGSCDGNHTGNGYQVFENGDYFEGYWKNGQPAWGVYIWANGDRFLGTFRNGEKIGSCFDLSADGSCYCGEMSGSVRHGRGAMWYKDGVYIGDWNNDLRHGKGGCRFDDGTCFLGEWRNDQPVK